MRFAIAHLKSGSATRERQRLREVTALLSGLQKHFNETVPDALILCGDWNTAPENAAVTVLNCSDLTNQCAQSIRELLGPVQSVYAGCACLLVCLVLGEASHSPDLPHNLSL